ncbi:MAG: hypothetical protein K0R24_686 [Gammaproteobacteria bacterium]|jgi:hypothetical protein|nr:hypothetical protein [Gammaproteobacteria bacterium]
MVNEKEERFDEEGEYHFSDDQMNDEAAPETLKATSTSAFTKEAMVAKLSQYRKGIVGGVSVITLITVIYKILTPSSAPPPTDFSKAAIVKAAKPVTTKTVKPLSPPVARPVATATQQPSTITTTTATPPVTPYYTQSNVQQNQVATTSAAVAPANQASTVAATTLPVSSGASANEMNVQTKNVLDRLTLLEQQNAAMMNLLQTEYAQKISDTETLENTTRGKIEEVTKRVNRMEANLNQITDLLKGMSKSQSSNGMENVSTYPSEARSTEPTTIYAVQAIIPGRAWLKSESGDTVTVAEGDYLKNYGRVSKIDPYDGIVAIDTGKKVITLSYGMGSD